MCAAKAASKLAVREGMIHMVARIIFSGVVTNPGFSIVHVRDVGMARLIAEVASRFNGVWIGPDRRGTMRRNGDMRRVARWTRTTSATMLLGKGWNGKNK
jgi:hypothetical protein